MICPLCSDDLSGLERPLSQRVCSAIHKALIDPCDYELGCTNGQDFVFERAEYYGGKTIRLFGKVCHPRGTDVFLDQIVWVADPRKK